VPPQLGRLAFQGIAIVADALDHLADFVGRHAVAPGERLHFVLLLAGHADAILAAHKSLVVGHRGLLRCIDGRRTTGDSEGSHSHHRRRSDTAERFIGKLGGAPLRADRGSVGIDTLGIPNGLYSLLLMVLISRATTVPEMLWLQLLNGPAHAALLTMPISYLQDAIKGRVGLSTSLLDVSNVVASLATAAVFGAPTASVQNYPQLLVVAAGLSVGGAVALLVAHWLLERPQPATVR